ncbi:MAG: formyltetrahydrofolate deformylase [Sulfurovum sp.]|nr:MAG: formyltetrahydrofolate deformylase [Sulfurovum sp.]
MEQKARVLIDCEDQKGLVYKISKVFFEKNLNIENNREFVDSDSGKFFMRSVVSGQFCSKKLREELIEVLPQHANLQVIEPNRKKIVIFVTKEAHALGDILIRYDDGELDVDIEAVISNHDTLRELVRRFDIPFIHIPTEGLSREEHEEVVVEQLDKLEFDYIVLAKYMRILNSSFVAKFPKKIINIHHSFLPAFVGANPYKQAYERGVKIIGATAHFVTDELDEGPIIAQDTINVNHRFDWKDMQNAGKDVEKVVLSRALKIVLNDRIFVNGNKTIVF